MNGWDSKTEFLHTHHVSRTSEPLKSKTGIRWGEASGDNEQQTRRSGTLRSIEPTTLLRYFMKRELTDESDPVAWSFLQGALIYRHNCILTAGVIKKQLKYRCYRPLNHATPVRSSWHLKICSELLQQREISILIYSILYVFSCDVTLKPIIFIVISRLWVLQLG